MVLEIPYNASSIGADALAKLKANWPKVLVLHPDILAEGYTPTTAYGFRYPYASNSDSGYIFISPQIGRANADHQQLYTAISIAKTGDGSITKGYTPVYPTPWMYVENKPFSTIGSGLKVVDDALTVDTQALPSALTIMQLSEFGELTDNTTTTHSATGDGNAAAYAKLKQAWPSVIVVEGGTSWRCGMYTPSNVEQAGYILVKSANITDSAIQMRIHGGGFPGAITLEEIGG